MEPETERQGGDGQVLDHLQLEIEGESFTWNRPTITTEEIARLGGWDPAQGVIVVDQDNNERTLARGEAVELKPGLGFGKRIRWKRG